MYFVLPGYDCDTGYCEAGTRCHDLDDGYTCACPLGKSGAGCATGVDVTAPYFNHTSYAAYRTLSDALSDLVLEMEVKPRSLDNGVFFYNSQDGSGNGDFIALSLKSGRVELQFDSGSGKAHDATAGTQALCFCCVAPLSFSIRVVF